MPRTFVGRPFSSRATPVLSMIANFVLGYALAAVEMASAMRKPTPMTRFALYTWTADLRFGT
jgi:hypothetical protein